MSEDLFAWICIIVAVLLILFIAGSIIFVFAAVIPAIGAVIAQHLLWFVLWCVAVGLVMLFTAICLIAVLIQLG